MSDVPCVRVESWFFAVGRFCILVLLDQDERKCRESPSVYVVDLDACGVPPLAPKIPLMLTKKIG